FFYVDVVVQIFFFFQAEDGIRDFHVTGVQTCALPIYLRGPPSSGQLAHRVREPDAPNAPDQLDYVATEPARVAVPEPCIGPEPEIGRASCREREWRAAGGGGMEMRQDKA